MAQQFNFQSFSVAEGLPQSQVYALLQSTSGHLWMGTQGGGLSQFDGQRFQNFSQRDGLSGNYIEALAEWQGQICVGTRNGFDLYDGKQFRHFDPDPQQNLIVTAFSPWQDSLLLIGTTRGLFVFNGKQVTTYQQIGKVRINCIYRVPGQKDVWIGTNRGAFMLNASGAKRMTRQDGLNADEIFAITSDGGGRIWLATLGGCNIWDGKRFDYLQSQDGLSSNYVRTLFTDRDDNVWVGTQDNGLSIWHPADSTLTNLNADQGLCNNYIRQIIQDAWGNIWLGTSGGGLCKYSGQLFRHYNISNRTADNLVYALCRDTLDRLWTAAADDGLARLDSSGWQFFGRAEGFADTKVKAMYCDRNGRLWFGSNGQGISTWQDSTFEFIKDRNGYPLGNWTRDFEEDLAGNLWIASASQGLIRLKARDTVFTIEKSIPIFNDSLGLIDSLYTQDSIVLVVDYKKYGRKEGIASVQINALHMDRQGRLWYASKDRGIGYLSNGNFQNFDKTNGLPSNQVRSIAEDSLGNIWIGTAGYGVCRIVPGQDTLAIRTFTEQEGLASSNIYLLEFDKQGYLWVGCGRGVDRIALDAAGNFKDVRHFGQTEGFYGVETCQNAVMRDPEGYLWFGTINGLTQYLPGKLSKNETPPRVQITGISLFYEPLEQTAYANWILPGLGLRPGLRLPYKDNHLGFSFAGVNLSKPGGISYQWKLEGQEADWSPLSATQSVSYSNISPGDYRFMLRAYNEDMVVSDPPLVIPFSIATPFWQRWWFITSLILGVLALMLLIFRTRLNQVRRKAKIEQERLALENTVLQLEQKALQLQMNPHFIFNALNSVQSLFLNEEREQARQLLSKFARLMRATLEHSRSQRISLEQEREILDHYLAIEQYSRGKKFNYSIEIDSALDPEEVQMPPMLLQPFVENAVIHGVGNLDREGKIEVVFKKENAQELQCTIRDNGVGRAASAERNARKTKKHQSMALDVTRERLELLNQPFGLKKSLEIIDLKHADGQANGTQVNLYLPLEEW